MKLSMSRITSATVMASLVVIMACGNTRNLVIGRDCEHGFCDDSPAFDIPDASGADASSSPTVAMCPVTTCSPPYVTCETSQFSCEVNTLTDDENCGGCGVSCRSAGVSTSTGRMTCVEGECTLTCVLGKKDCNHDTSDGCETSTDVDERNCGECGEVCPSGSICSKGQCVLECDLTIPGMAICDGRCTNLYTDPLNCGVCGTLCQPYDPSLPALPSDMHYTCGDGRCNAAVCNEPRRRANCNGLLSDGCEVDLLSPSNCGACNNVCPPGKPCAAETPPWVDLVSCLCSDEQATPCPGASDGQPPCRRLDQDPANCGACYRRCPGLGRAHYQPTCSFGVCGGACIEGYEDCDKLEDNGCETNLTVDNRNCGACGNACAPNQVCSQGRCLFAPCDDPETK